MKKLLFIIAVTTILFSSCGSRTNEHTDSHNHDDGSVHADHQNNSDTIPEQEVFEVKDESDHEHSHEEGHDHQH